ncbi:hypothetical protein RGQ21_67760 [Kitasatospora aureofaciens]|nr:hypothetical protein RGQ21_67760 [Kitasatospora aureofaciens]
MLVKSEALKALEEGKTLVGASSSNYAGERIEYLPRNLTVPDFYPWHVVGRPDEARLNVQKLEVQA